ncbi:response regulator transcription factor [Halodesulfovibrio sp. MK-HDV]|jgi:DNA-binding NarL/FixJ family response regulator|uniref:response regulator n=1 Tax=Halodesulfovibrio sp. MK-HDV TaxID=2599925 RepID=UPI00136A3455|nr:response regulator transcription factor [Halodesulfovibrio sp. MK-HDV]KAF1076347.1 Transcriptional regulatory protein DegU [Halodesulfovibrio sp. MK-HDV]
MTKHRIAIIEDHALFRAGLCSLISSKPDLEVIGEAGDGLEAIQLVRDNQPTLILIDLSMPKLGGIEAIRQIKQIAPDTKILVVSMHVTEKHLRAALKAGADGYLLKMADQDEFYVAIQAILGGRSYVSSDLASLVLDVYRSQEPEDHSSFDTLTNREREILKLVAEGNANKDIANLLTISPKTVDNHRSNIMRKLELHNVVELTHYARQYGLLVED